MKNTFRIITYILIIALFNLIFWFVGGTEHSTATWCAYGFAHIAMIATFVSPFYCYNYKRIPENLTVIYSLSWLYTAIAFVLNCIFILTKVENVKLCVIINTILLVLYIILLLVNIYVNHNVEKNIENIDAERQFVRETSSKLKMCMALINDMEIKKSVERAYDSVRTSPLHSSSQAMTYEVEIIRLVSLIEQKIDNNAWDDIPSISTEIVKNVQKRNSVL